MVEVHLQNPVWKSRLELDGAAIPQNFTTKEFQKGNAHYLVEALEQPLLLPKDMVALQTIRQQDLFLSLKRDLALVSFLARFTDISLGYFFLIQ